MTDPKTSNYNPAQVEEKKEEDLSYTSSSANIATINDLPDELILDIVVCIARHSGERDPTRPLRSLARFSITNRRFYRITTPSLYSTYRAQYDPYLFLRTVSGAPALGNHVQNAIFYPSNQSCPNHTYWNLHLGRKGGKKVDPEQWDCKQIAEGLRRLGLIEWKGQARMVNQIHVRWGKLWALILLHTPNTKHIDYITDRGYVDRDEAFQFITRTGNLSRLARLAGHENFLSNVKQMSIKGGDIGDLRGLSLLFNLKLLRTLELRSFHDRSPQEFWKDKYERKKLPLLCNNLETLSFVDSFFRPDLVHFLLESTRNLQHLSIGLIRGPPPYFGPDNFYAIAAETALMRVSHPVRNSLKTLRFHYHRDVRVGLGGFADQNLVRSGEAHDIELKCHIRDLLEVKHPGSMNLNDLLPRFKCSASIRTSDASVAEWVGSQSLTAGPGNDEPWTVENAQKYSLEHLRAAHTELVKNLISSKLDNPSIGLVASVHPQSDVGSDRWFRETCGRRDPEERRFQYSVPLPSVACCYR